MALTLNNIDINVRKGYDAAHAVSEAENALYSAWEEALSITEELRGYWTGDNATAFIAHIDEQAETLRQHAMGLGKIAGAMRETVALYEQNQKAQYYAEQQAREEAAEQRRQAKGKK